MGVHAKGHCGKYHIQTKYTFNRCQQKFTLLILCTQKPSSLENKKICCFCVWDIPVIMLIMKIIYEIKSYKTYNIVKSIHVSPMNTYASKSLI